MESIATIGYEGATVAGFLEALTAHGVELLVDIRAVASSRRPGFAKTALAANLEGAGIAYLHYRGLGTPADGRAAARAGKHDEMKRIYRAHLATHVAREELHAVAELVHVGRRIALMCFEADAAHCHRSLVADALAAQFPLEVTNLTVRDQFAD
jgi:uncharacterized protein (DUF488 family)